MLAVVRATDTELRRDIELELESARAGLLWIDTAGHTTSLQDVVSYPRKWRSVRTLLGLVTANARHLSSAKRAKIEGRPCYLTEE